MNYPLSPTQPLVYVLFSLLEMSILTTLLVRAEKVISFALTKGTVISCHSTYSLIKFIFAASPKSRSFAYL